MNAFFYTVRPCTTPLIAMNHSKLLKRTAMLGQVILFSRMRTSAIFVISAIFMLFPVASSAQAIDEQGVKPYGSYHVGDVDMVSLQSAKLEVHAPLLEYKQRGRLQLAFGLRYESAMWNETKSCGIPRQPCTLFWRETNNTGRMQFVLEPGLPTMSDQVLVQDPNCSTCMVSAHTLALGDGSQHALGNLGGVNATTFESLDATGLKWDSSAQTVTMADGTRYINPFGGTPLVEDANGNQILINLNAGTITDTIGRNIPYGSNSMTSTSDFSGCTGPLPTISASVWTIPWANGGTNIFKFCYANVQIFTHHFTFDDSHHIEPNGPVSMLQSIVLPEQMAWTFEYSQPDANGVNWGDLTKITYPTGASVSYTWAHITGCHGQYGFLGSTASTILSRTVDANDGRGPHQWLYSVVAGTPSGTVTISDPMGNDTVHTITNLSGCSLYETQTQYFSGTHTSGTLLKTITTDYSWGVNPNFPNGTGVVGNSPAMNVVAIRKTTSWPNGQVTKTEYAYDSGFSFTDAYGTNSFTGTYGKQIAVNDFDFGSGAAGSLLRSAQTSYFWQSPAGAQYSNYNVLNVPSTTQVFDGAGNSVAQTNTSYDQVLPTASGITTQLDVNPINGNVRGNPTSHSQWLNGSTVSTSNCPVAVTNGFLTSTTRYFDTGTISQSSDPCGHMATIQYSSTYAGALPTSVCDALNHCHTMTYDFNTAALASTTDANNQVTSSTYDNFGRLTQITYPDNGEADFFYPNPTTVEKKVVIDRATTLWADGFFYFDGLGRRKQTRLVDPEGDVYTETTYDALGRVSNVTNPHRLIAAATDGSTTTQYDPLNRPVLVTHNPDGNFVQTAFADPNISTVTDETGRQRQNTTDALGRLVQVAEPGDSGSLSQPYLTLYSYDALGNLARVEQHGNSAQWRVRTFDYDSLSHMTQSYNPESGQMTYNYDADGNVIFKTAPAPSQPPNSGTTVTTNFIYDPLHRVTTKSYTGNGYTETTPAVSYGFDQGCCGVNPVNGVGRLTYANSGNTELVYVYDPMGRISTQFDCPPSGIARGSCYSIGASYNQIGGIKTLNYPSGRQVNFSYNADGRFLSANLAIPGGGQYSYYAAAQGSPNDASSWGYWPTGAMRLGNFGNGASELSGYNSRLQMNSIAVSIGANTLFSKSYNLYDSAGHNNGNVLGITDLLNSAKNQTYSYDALNRIATAVQSDNAFNITFTVDPWGNMNESGTSNFTPLFDSQNHMQGWSYDSAGNLLADAAHSYAYDAENRVSKVDVTGASYTYNPLGNRVRKDVGSTPTEYFFFAGNVIAELNPNTAAWTDYIFGGKERYAKDSSSNGSGVQYYHSDHLGTTRIMTDASGAKISDCTYGPFGEEIGCSPGNTSNHYKFTGKERDGETGLDAMGQRYHSSAMGRLMTPDPLMLQKQKLLDPQQWNMYQYARDNPLRFVDPTGMYTTSCTQTDISKCDQNTQNFEKARQEALKSSDKNVVAAAKAYGNYGEKNNVAVGFQTKEASSVKFATNSKGAVTGIDVSINSKTLSGITQEKDANGETTLGFARAVADVAHEGSHVQTDQALIDHHMDPGFNLTNRQSEHPAYKITDSVLRSYGWAGTDASGHILDLSNDTVIDKFLDSLPPEGQEPLDGHIYTPPK
jgi:RHS repeat-associated protein